MTTVLGALREGVLCARGAELPLLTPLHAMEINSGYLPRGDPAATHAACASAFTLLNRLC